MKYCAILRTLFYRCVCIFAALAINSLSFGQQSSPQSNLTTPQKSGTTAWSATTSSASVANTDADIYKQPALSKPAPMEVIADNETNYTSFTPARLNKTKDAIAHNKGFENDPELGMLFPGAPCSNCYELIGKRTERQKYFVTEGSDATKFILRSSVSPIHYKDSHGRWRTITNQLQQDKIMKGLYTTTGRAVNISVNTTAGYVKLSSASGDFTYNHNLELIFVRPDGTEQNLGAANWHSYTAGDDGMYITDAWPGIDIELNVLASSLKTNFVVNQALPAYAGGKLLVRDHIKPGRGLSLDKETASSWSGELKVQNNQGYAVFTILKAIAYEQKNSLASLQPLSYSVHSGTLDIEVPGSLLGKPASAYPLIIDPLVSGTTGAGFSYGFPLGSTTISCLSNNSVPIPASSSLSDIRITHTYKGVVGANFIQSAAVFEVNGNCSTGITGCTGACTGLGTGGTSCGMSGSSFWGPSAAYGNWGTTPGCLPAAGCAAYTLNFQLYASQQHTSTGPCASTVFATVTGFTVDVYGSATPPPTITPAGAANICLGSTLPLSGSPMGGIWSSSNTSIATVSVSGIVTAIAAGTATVSYTDGCSISDTKVITVETTPTVAPITGLATLCQTTSTILSDATTGGAWSSSAAAVASVGSTGSVTGLTPGTVSISYSYTNSCGTAVASHVMTVNPTPSAGSITGVMASGWCIGASITLSDPAPGGFWSSTSTGVATVGSTGVVHCVAVGSSTIRYSVSGTFCTSVATATVTVGPTLSVAPISGSSSVCRSFTITLSDPTPGGSWSSSAAGIASVSATGVVSGVTLGTATISYTVANTCNSATATRVVTDNPYFSGPTGTIYTIAGNGLSGSTGDLGPATAAEITPLTGITVDTTGTIFIIDSFSSIRGITPLNIISTYTTTGVYPFNMAADRRGNMYFIEYGSPNVYKITGSSGSLFATGMNYPWGICTDTAGNVYVACFGNNSVSKITPAGVVSLFAGDGSTAASGDGGPATAAGLGYAWGVAADTNGNVFISTAVTGSPDDYIRKVDASGTISTICGTGISGFSGDGGPATAAQIDYATSIATDPAGNLYLCDANNNRIRKIDARTGIINTVAGTGTPSPYTSDGIPATSANLGSRAVYVDHQGNVLIGDGANHRLMEIPVAPGIIVGNNTICAGSTTAFTDTFFSAYGSWSSSNTLVASVGTSGLVTGIAGGSATITYRVTSTCGSAFATRIIYVNPMPSAGTITGSSTVCATATTPLTDAAPGGLWSTSLPGIATITASGVVRGISVGTVVITYSVTVSSCASETTFTMTVNPQPVAGTISGPHTTICVDSAFSVTDPAPGGTWGHTQSSLSVSATGAVSGVTPGADTVTYSVTNSCGTAVARYPVTVIGCTEKAAAITSGSETINVFPNPTTGQFTIAVNTPVTEEVTIVITNLLGEKIKQFTTTSNTHTTLSLGQVPGTYLLTAHTSRKTATVRITLTK